MPRTASPQSCTPSRRTPGGVRIVVGLLAWVMAGIAGVPAFAHQIEKPTGNLLLSGTDARDFIYVNDPNGCTADFITAASTNPLLFQVAAVDMNTKQVGPFGSTAIAFNRIDQVFAVRSMAPTDTSDVGVGQVEICWVESAGAPCNEDNCAGPATVDVTVLRNQQADGALDFAFDGGDPINLGTGGLYLPHRRLLDLGGPMGLQLTVYYDSKLFTDGLIGMAGFNWLTNFDWLLLPAGNNRQVVTPRGRIIRFEKGYFDSTWTLRPRRHIPFQLLEVGGNFVFIDPRDQRIYTFSPIGKLLKVEDGRGNTLTLTHDFADRVQMVSDGLGRQLTFTYGVGLATATDGTRTVTFGYTGNDVTTITDPAGYPTTFTYALGSLGLMESETRPEGNTPFTQTWDGKERVATQTDAYGNTSTVLYDDAVGERTYINPLPHDEAHGYGPLYTLQAYTDDLGASAIVSSDSVGRREALTDRESGVTAWIYKPENGKLASVQHADGKTTTYLYTSRLLNGLTFYDLTGVQRPDASSETFGYDAQGNLTSWTDGESNTWTFGYNGKGQVTTVMNPATGMTVHTWNPDGTLDSSTDPASNTTSFDYDPLKRINKITRPGGTFRTLVYDERDLVTSLTDEESQTTTFGYDMNGNLTSVTTPLSLTTSYGYDLLDRLVSITNHLGHTDSISYDAAGRAFRYTDANGNTILYGRDGRGYVTSLTDGESKLWQTGVDDEGVPTSLTTPLNRTVLVSSDDMGRITGVSSPLGNPVNVIYDDLGRVVQLTDALGRVTDATRDGRGLISDVDYRGVTTSYLRNVFGQITQVTDPRSKIWQRAYDDGARLTSKTDPLARTTTFDYDNRNRRSLITFPGGLGSATFTYDDVNRLTGQSCSDGTNLSFVYDDDDRLTAATGIGLGYDDANRMTTCNGLTMTYDPGDRLLSVTLAPGKSVTYGYDGRNLVTSVTDWVGGVTTLTYDDDGRLDTITRPNSVTSTYVHDDDGRIESIQHGGLGSVALTRDDAGQITTATRDWPTVATPPVAVQALTYDDANQVSGRSYDANGRVLNDGTRSLDWDLVGRATEIDHGGGPVTFSYDAMGRVTTRTESGTTREFAWNYAFGIPVISVERETGSGDVRYYVHTPGGILLHSIDASDDSRRFHHEDEVGNTVFLTNDAGAVTDSYAYDPWGVLLAESGATENRYTWGGTYGAMREGELYRIGDRLYQPVEAHWLSRDPIESVEPRSVNPYQAMYGNPSLYVDPLGNEPLIVLNMLLEALYPDLLSRHWRGHRPFMRRLEDDVATHKMLQTEKDVETATIDSERLARERTDREEFKHRLREQRADEDRSDPQAPRRRLPEERFPELEKAGYYFVRQESDVPAGSIGSSSETAPSPKVDPNVPPRPADDRPAQFGGPIQVTPQTLHEQWMDEFMRSLVPAPEPPPPGADAGPDTFERPPSSFTPSIFLPSAAFEPVNYRLFPWKMRRDVEGPVLPVGASAEIKERKRFP